MSLLGGIGGALLCWIGAAVVWWRGHHDATVFGVNRSTTVLLRVTTAVTVLFLAGGSFLLIAAALR